ncbi:hypothetical protein AX17_007541 [Amanita inopinata Kibby_2008]|nr:hypothetical protein AX17_007541 [Amanita inopinata Kibby_2008]
MVALDPQITMLAAQCILSLVALPSGATAIALRSPHSSQHEDSGELHPHRHAVLPAPRRKKAHQSLHAKHSPASVSNASGKHREHERSLGAEEAQKAFQTRGVPLTDTVTGLVNPVLQIIDGALKTLPGGDPLGSLITRHHHDHDHYREKIIYELAPSHVHIHRRSSLSHPMGHNNVERRDQKSVPGTIDIMSNGVRIASLCAARVNGTSLLNACTGEATQVYLVDPSSSSSSQDEMGSGQDMLTLLKLSNDFSNTGGIEHCATFNANPTVPEPLTIEPCLSATAGGLQKSQYFAYNSDTGIVQPVWSAGEDDGTTDATTASATSTGSNNSECENNGSTENVRINARDDGNGSSLQNVTLVFKTAESMGTADSTSTNADHQMTASATTITVTETVTETGATSPTDAAAETFTASTGQGDGSQATSTTLSTQPSSGTMDVEVVIPSSNLTVPGRLTPTPSVTNGNSSATSSSASSSTIDPESVAASLAAQNAGGMQIASSTMTDSEAPNPTTPSLIVQVAEKETSSMVSDSKMNSQ